VMTTLLEETLFELPDGNGAVSRDRAIVMDGKAVQGRLKEIVEDEDLRRYIL
jgi:ATP-dependent protease HslVU (ClpYQ) ATPase subunit